MSDGNEINSKPELKPLTPKEHGDLFLKVDNEGFGYYMLDYGPDLGAIARLGFDVAEVERAIALFARIEEAIDEGEEFACDEDEDEDPVDDDYDEGDWADEDDDED